MFNNYNIYKNTVKQINWINMCYIIILVFSSSDTGDRMEDNNEMVEHWNQLKLNSFLILPVKPTRVSPV